MLSGERVTPEALKHPHPHAVRRTKGYEDTLYPAPIDPAPASRSAQRFAILYTALASSWNSSRATELGAYSATVRPLAPASATTIRWPIGGSTFFPIFSSDSERPRPRLVFDSTLERTKRMRGFLDRLCARAFNTSDSASLSANRSRGDGPHGNRTRSATIAAS